MAFMTAKRVTLPARFSAETIPHARGGEGRPRLLAAATLIGLYSATLIVGASCTVSRRTGPGRPLGDYDYCVVRQKDAYRYTDEARRILDQVFVVLQDDDPRLSSPAIRQKACMLSLYWSRGFWSSSASADVKDYDSNVTIHQSHIRRGMFYTGYHADVMEVLADVAAARAAGPPVPPDARTVPPPSTNPPDSARSKADRLMELNDLKARGLITEAEYTEQRTKILNER